MFVSCFSRQLQRQTEEEKRYRKNSYNNWTDRYVVILILVVFISLIPISITSAISHHVGLLSLQMDLILCVKCLQKMWLPSTWRR